MHLYFDSLSMTIVRIERKNNSVIETNICIHSQGWKTKDLDLYQNGNPEPHQDITDFTYLDKFHAQCAD